MSEKNLFHPNHPLAELIERDPGVSPAAKNLFAALCNPDSNVDGVNQFCELIRRNYIWIDGFPPQSTTLPAGYDRSKRANRWRALKAIFTGEL